MRYIPAMVLLAAALPAQNFEVVAAYYGFDRSFVDVTAAVRAQAGADGMSFTVGADTLGGDPFPGQLKSLRVYYRLAGQFQPGEWKDSETVRLGRFNGAGQRGIGRERGGRIVANTPLTITRALYGAAGRTVDVTSILQERIQNNQLAFDVPGAQLGDPAPGSVKELLVNYQWEGRTLEARVRDGERLVLPLNVALAPPVLTPVATGLKIISAQYGSGNRVTDVAALLTGRISGHRLTSLVDNKSMGGDPAVGADKVVNVSYDWNGQRYTASAKEGQTLRLPPDNLVASSPAPPATPVDGACLYPGQNFQGAPVCAALGQDQARMSGPFGSIRLFGRVRQVDLFESANFAGRTVRLTADLADLSQAGGGGFFGNTSAWASNLGSFRLSQ